MLPDTGIDDVKKQRNAKYAKHINDPVLSSLKMEGIRLLFFRTFKHERPESYSVRFYNTYSTFTEWECLVDTKAMEKLGHGLLVSSRFSPGFSRNRQ
jgi:hypothetical protein